MVVHGCASWGRDVRWVWCSQRGVRNWGTGNDVIVLFREFHFPGNGFVILGMPKLARVHYNLSYMKY
jgi:hypothetical protein